MSGRLVYGLVALLLAVALLVPQVPPSSPVPAVARISGCPQLINNPSFEQGDSYWLGYYYMPNITDYVAYDGSYSATFVPKYAASIIYQYLPDYPGSAYDDYYVVGHVYITPTPSDYEGRTEIYVYSDASGEPIVEIEIVSYPDLDQEIIICVEGFGCAINGMDVGFNRWVTIEFSVVDYDSSRDRVTVYIDGRLILDVIVDDMPDVNEVILRWWSPYQFKPYWDLILFYDLGSCT